MLKVSNKLYNGTDIGNHLKTISKLKNAEEYIDYIKNTKSVIYGSISLCILSNIDINIFRKIITKLDINILIDKDYIDFHFLIEIEAYNYMYEILIMMQNNYKNILEELLYKEDDKKGSFLIYLFTHMPINYIELFWKIGKNTHLTYEDNINNKNLLMILITKYLNHTYNNANNVNNKNITKKLLNIIKYYINKTPKLLYKPKYIPILSYIIAYESRFLKSFPFEITIKTKYKTDLNKDVIELIKFILIKQPNVINLIDSNGRHPLIYIIMSNHIGLFDFIMRYKHININSLFYCDNGNSLYNILITIIKESNEDMQKHIIKYFDMIDFNTIDIYMLNYAMYGIKYYDQLKYKLLLNKIIEYSDNLYECDIYGNTILHYICTHIYILPIIKNDLIKKKLNFSKKSVFEQLCIDYIDTKDIENKKQFNKFMIEYYKYHNEKDKLTDAEIINKMLYISNNVKNSVDNYILIKYNNADFSIFNNSFTATIIYYYLCIGKYDIFGMPYYEFKNDDTINMIICDKLQCKKNKECANKDDIAICDDFNNTVSKTLIYPSIYFNVSFYWYNTLINNIPYKLYEGIENMYKKTNRYIYSIFITIIYGGSSYHANTLIINIKDKIVIRFEPFGKIDGNWAYDIEMDEYIEKYFLLHDKKFIYIRPSDYLPKVSFQSISKNIYDEKYGAPDGFCAAWSIWFLETFIININYIKNADDLKKLCSNLFYKILETNDSIYTYICDAGNYMSNLVYKFLNKYITNDRYIKSKYIKQFTNDEIEKCYSYIDDKIYKMYKKS